VQVVPIPRNTEFLLLATVTAEAAAGVRDRDLSPALYNRFCIIYMPDIGVPVIGDSVDSAVVAGRKEAEQIMSVVSGGMLARAQQVGGALMDLKLAQATDAGGKAINIALEDNANAAVGVFQSPLFLW
jgi:hypothetical protein